MRYPNKKMQMLKRWGGGGGVLRNKELLFFPES